MISSLLWALVGGTVLGLLGKSLAPGEPDHVPLWLAILGGIGGALLGTWLYSLAYEGAGTGTDWWRHAWQVVTAALLLSSAMLMRVETKAQLFGYPALAVLLFLVATALGLTIALSALLSDRKARPNEQRGPH